MLLFPFLFYLVVFPSSCSEWRWKRRSENKERPDLARRSLHLRHSDGGGQRHCIRWPQDCRSVPACFASQSRMQSLFNFFGITFHRCSYPEQRQSRRQSWLSTYQLSLLTLCHSSLTQVFPGLLVWSGWRRLGIRMWSCCGLKERITIAPFSPTLFRPDTTGPWMKTTGRTPAPVSTAHCQERVSSLWIQHSDLMRSDRFNPARKMYLHRNKR